MTLKQDTIIDATLITAPGFTNTKAGERDAEIHPTCKGMQWHLRMKADIGVDTDNGHIHLVETTPANMQDLTLPAGQL